MLKYGKKKFNQALNAVSIKSMKQAPGTLLHLGEIRESGDSTPSLNLDSIIAATDKGVELSIPMREYRRYKSVDNKPTFVELESENGEDLVGLPTTVRIVESKDRVITRNGVDVTVYPVNAYNAGQQQITDRKFDFDALVASGLTENGAKMDPVQDYVLEIVAMD